MRIMHRYTFTSLALGGILFLSSFLIPVDAYAQAYGKDESGTYRMADGTPIENVYARGIDVSHWKQEIDWNAVAADDVSFVMLGTRYQGDVDPYFRVNAEGAHAAGIQLGAYIYSYATTPEMASQEADFVLDLVKDYPISYPIAFDVEDNGTLGNLTPSQVSDIINAFCSKIEDAGYYPLVYANDNWLANKIDMSQVPYDVWVARYGKKPAYSDPVMWQATSTGAISGVNGSTDIDFQFTDFSGLIPDSLWRTIGDTTYFYKNYTMQKNTWADDQGTWYFFDQNGQPKKGWFLSGTDYYYLDNSTGAMKTGWLDLDGSWYYLNGSGQMQTGWNQINSFWYYLNQSGQMQTGWLKDGNETYYLGSSGAMKTGWSNIGNYWYFFNPAGQMQTQWICPDGNWYYLDQEGKMQTRWLKLNGIWYYLTSSGQMATGLTEVSGNRYYLNGSGAMETGMITIDGKSYYFDPESGGAMAVNRTVMIDGISYLAGTDGVLTVQETEAPAETGAPSEETAETAETAEPSSQSVGPGAF